MQATEEKKRFILKWREVAYAESYVTAGTVADALQKGLDFEDESYEIYDGSQSYEIVEIYDDEGNLVWEKPKEESHA